MCGGFLMTRTRLPPHTQLGNTSTATMRIRVCLPRLHLTTVATDLSPVPERSGSPTTRHGRSGSRFTIISCGSSRHDYRSASSLGSVSRQGSVMRHGATVTPFTSRLYEWLPKVDLSLCSLEFLLFWYITLRLSSAYRRVRTDSFLAWPWPSPKISF